MAGITSRYGLQRLQAGDAFSLNGYAYTDANREQIDRLLYAGAEGHVHSGVNAAAVNPTVGLTLAIDTTTGNLPAGVRVYYKYAYVDGAGNISAGSPESFYDIPPGTAVPAAPVLSTSSTGGTLVGGQYFYVLSAYKGTNAAETLATNPASIPVPTGTVTNSNTVTFPTLPAGANGFNVYRRTPTGSSYLYIKSVAVTGGLPATYVDTGADDEDCNRTLPTTNTTASTNSITATLPTAVPVGYTWNLYRTFTAGQYGANSLVHRVIETTGGAVNTSHKDLGSALMAGRPPTTSQLVGSPSKVNLTDSAEVQGTLPLGRIHHFPEVLAFTFNGEVTALMGTTAWVCEYPAAFIVGVRAALGRSYTPTGTDVIVDVNKGPGTANPPTYASIFTTQANRPKVLIGKQLGAIAIPDVQTLVAGDVLTVDIDQTGGTTSRDLTVNIVILASFTNPLSDDRWYQGTDVKPGTIATTIGTYFASHPIRPVQVASVSSVPAPTVTV